MSKLLEVISFLIKKKYKVTLLIIGFLGIIFIFYSDYLLWSVGVRVENITYTNKLLGSIYFLTFVAILWYTRETHDLKVLSRKTLVEARKQIELEAKPYIILKWLDEKNTIKVSNIGKGIAKQLEFEFSSEAPGEFYKNLKCLNISALSIGNDSSELIFYDEFNSKLNTNGDIFKIKFHPQVNNGYEIRVKYREASTDKEHHAIFKPNWRFNDRFKIEEQD